MLMDSQKGQKKTILKKEEIHAKNIFFCWLKNITHHPGSWCSRRSRFNRQRPTPRSPGRERQLDPSSTGTRPPPPRAPSGPGLMERWRMSLPLGLPLLWTQVPVTLKRFFFVSLLPSLSPLPPKHGRNSSLISLAVKKSRVADPEFFRNIHSGSESRFKYLV